LQQVAVTATSRYQLSLTCKKSHALTLKEESREADRSIYSLSGYHTSPHNYSRRAKASSVSSKTRHKTKERQIKKRSREKAKNSQSAL
jgi:hypothetical protein